MLTKLHGNLPDEFWDMLPWSRVLDQRTDGPSNTARPRLLTLKKWRSESFKSHCITFFYWERLCYYTNMSRLNSLRGKLLELLQGQRRFTVFQFNSTCIHTSLLRTIRMVNNFFVHSLSASADCSPASFTLPLNSHTCTLSEQDTAFKQRLSKVACRGDKLATVWLVGIPFLRCKWNEATRLSL